MTVHPQEADCFKELVLRSGGRITRSRLAILETVADMEGHFLPEDLAHTLESRGRRVSLTTIYRNLPLLVEAGIVRRTCISEGGAIRYERVLGSEHHDHLICSRCGRQVEFSYPAIEILQDAVAREHGFTLEHHCLELVGTCADCRSAGGTP